jgi:hypothetical protein
MNLSRAQAQMAFVRGHKISHKYFMEKEFVQLNSKKEMVDETGIILNKTDFWINRGGESFDYGWFVIE